MSSGVRHALARMRAAARRRSNAERPDRRAWSGVRVPRGAEWSFADGHLTLVPYYPPTRAEMDRAFAQAFRALREVRA